jgi:tetratricopeptide (TPR) repeat protein
MVAEAKFLRAFQYFDLLRNFGGVPLITTMAMPSDASSLKRATSAETYAMIEKDLTEAIPYLPLKSAYASTDLGRVTKGAAQGLLGKIYLYQEKYKEAETQLQAVINSGEYDLLPNFGDVWTIANNNSVESLFEVQTNSDVTYSLGERISVVTGSRDDSGWSWGLPTSDLENAFKAEGDSIRRVWTILKDGQTSVPGDATWTVDKPYQIKASEHKSGRCNRKLYIPMADRPSPYDAPHIPLNYRLLRYADVLLMYAEVENQLGYDTEAQKALNKVRTRVKLNDVTSTGTTLRDAIRKERRLELALENNRLFDLRRWNDDNGKKAIENVMGKNGTFVLYNTVTSTDTYEKGNQKERSDKGINFVAPRDLLFPIPHTEITQSNGSITQNPDY